MAKYYFTLKVSKFEDALQEEAAKIQDKLQADEAEQQFGDDPRIAHITEKHRQKLLILEDDEYFSNLDSIFGKVVKGEEQIRTFLEYGAFALTEKEMSKIKASNTGSKLSV